MYGDGDDRKVEVVEHDWDVVVEASSRVEVEGEGSTADQWDGCNLCQPGQKDTKRKGLESAVSSIAISKQYGFTLATK